MTSVAADHYDAVAVAGAGVAQTQSRHEPRSALQQFHNEAKRVLLATYAAKGGALLDLACGRGGDVHKWISLGIQRVKGLDVSPASVREARSRLAARNVKNEYEFHVANLLRPWTDGQQYDTVTCMFALHYFFRTEDDADRLLHTVSAHLRPGGHFVGIVPDAQRVVECINPAEPHASNGVFDNGVVCVRARWCGKPQPFGSAYRCTIRGTVTEDSEVDEFLVYASVLKTLAARHGLVAVDTGPPTGCAAEGVFGEQGVLVPPYGGALGRATSLFSAFAFRKTV